MKQSKVSILGLGYVGLPTLVAIARSQKYDVVGFDIDRNRIAKIQKRQSPIDDPTVQSYLTEQPVTVSFDKHVLKGSNVFIITVPTPIHNDFSPDYSYVLSAVETCIPFLTKDCHIVLESTVNPGTCKELIIPLLLEKSQLRVGRDYNLAHCPERINPGDAHWTIYNINRNIGSITKQRNNEIAAFYQSFLTDATINQVSSIEIAEATKIVENTFRDINIAFVNELAKSFDAMHINLKETLSAAANKPFGFMPHWPGCGVGGHCIAVDPYYLIRQAQKSGFDHKFVKLAREINTSMPLYTIERLVSGLNQISLPVKGTTVAVLGLAFKPNIQDTRESPSWELIKELNKLGARVKVYDPFVKTATPSLKAALTGTDAVIIATGHDVFVSSLPKLLRTSTVKLVIDGRNCLDKKTLQKNKIVYKGIGQ